MRRSKTLIAALLSASSLHSAGVQFYRRSTASPSAATSTADASLPKIENFRWRSPTQWLWCAHGGWAAGEPDRRRRRGPTQQLGRRRTAKSLLANGEVAATPTYVAANLYNKGIDAARRPGGVGYALRRRTG